VPHLTILNGPSRGRIVDVGTSIIRMGREPGLEISLNDGKASRVHAELQLQDGQYILRDLKSKNGTLVNNQTVSALTLKEGDQVQVGETRLAFSLQAAPKIQESGRVDHDSILASRLPVGAVPSTGSAGMAGGGERFETLEMTAPLNLLKGEVIKAAETGSVSLPTERANRSLRALYDIARAAAEAKSTTQLWKELCTGLRTALEADRVTPILLDDKGAWDSSEAAERAALGPDVNFSKVPASRTIVDYAIRTARSVLTAPRNDSRFGGAHSIGEQGITSAMCAPILVQDKLLGLVYADRLGGIDFEHEDHELLTAACLQAAPALLNLQRLEEALEKKDRLLKELKGQYNLLGSSTAMKGVLAFIERAAPTNAVVLVLGESGTGKELVARAIHYNSKRSDGPLVIVNCAALTESLIESELFGHTKGAFTGATSDRPGRFEMADGGTIFLDEIGELSNSCQTKLLRVLEQGEISRVGEGRVRKVDVRVIAATNRDLQVEVKASRFREDLFYRLNVLSVSLPPLHERGGDVRLLLEHYLQDAATRSGRAKLQFSDDALAALLSYRWPGNVRELRNLAERVAVLCPSETITLMDLPTEYRYPPKTEASMPAVRDTPSQSNMAAVPAGKSGSYLRSVLVDTPERPFKLSEIEKRHILFVLEACEGNKKLAAEKLAIDRSTLYAKLRAYGLLS